MANTLLVAVRWTARIWSIASALVVVPFLFPGESMHPTAQEALGLLCFPGGMLLGFAIAWWREGLGGIVTLLSMVLFYLWIYQRDGRVPMSPYFLLLAAPGLLFVLYAAFRRSKLNS